MQIDYDAPMGPEDFTRNLKRLGLSVYASKDVLGISLRQAQRYASGEETIPKRTVQHLRILVDDIEYHKRRRVQLLKQLEFMRRPDVRMTENNRDITRDQIQMLEEYLEDCEKLLLEHPSGISLPRVLWEPAAMTANTPT